ncbi:MAG: spore maturation protein [Clostridia bacterium]
MNKYIIPTLFCAVLIYAFVKKVPIYATFTESCKESLTLVFSIFPYICAIFIATELFSQSGLATVFAKMFLPLFKMLGIPVELVEIIILRPLSGNGSIALLQKIYQNYGVDSYIARCASTIVGSSETIFYVSTLYFSTTQIKKLRYAIPLALFCHILGVIFSCLLCKFL